MRISMKEIEEQNAEIEGVLVSLASSLGGHIAREENQYTVSLGNSRREILFAKDGSDPLEVRRGYALVRVHGALNQFAMQQREGMVAATEAAKINFVRPDHVSVAVIESLDTQRAIVEWYADNDTMGSITPSRFFATVERGEIVYLPVGCVFQAGSALPVSEKPAGYYTEFVF